MAEIMQLSLFSSAPLTTSNFPSEKLEKKSSENKISEKGKEKPPVQIYAEALSEYLPSDCVNYVCEMLVQHEVFVKITKHRHTKLGDYHPPRKEKGHKITINHSLNKFSFLITMLHELAHLAVHEKYKSRTKPHGNEWKNEFRKILKPFIQRNNFPEELICALNDYLQNPAASSCTDTNLLKELKKFDKNNSTEKTFHLEELSENTFFSLSGNSKIFRKGKKLRKRFLCKEINSKRNYLVSPVAEVKIVEK